MAKEVTTKKLLEEIIEGIRNRKGERIVQIDLRKIKEAPVEYMIIAQGNSNTQVAAIAAEVDDHVRTVTQYLYILCSVSRVRTMILSTCGLTVPSKKSKADNYE